MRKSLFLKIVDELTTANDFFKQKKDAARHLGFSHKQKCTVAIKMLVYDHVPTLWMMDFVWGRVRFFRPSRSLSTQ